MKKLRLIVLAALLNSLFLAGFQLNAQTVLKDGSVLFKAEKAIAGYFEIEQLSNEVLNLAKSLSAQEQEAARAICIRNFGALKKKFIQQYIASDFSESSIQPAINHLKEKLAVIFNSEKGREKLNSIYNQLEIGHERHTRYHNHSIRGPGDPCTNPNAENCNFTGWDLYQGEVPYPATAPFSYINVNPTIPGGTWTGTITYNNGGSFADQHYVVTGGTDPQGGFPMVNPDGGSCSFMLGDYTQWGNGAASMSQTFLVSNTNAIFTYSYAVVLEDPSGHSVAEKPYFRVRMYDQGGNTVGCASNEAYGGDGQAGWVLVPGLYQYKTWTTVFIPLTNYVGQNVTIEFTVGDCAQGGHYGYAYIEASCDPITLIQGGQQPCAASVTLTAPPGASSYLWTPGGQTTQNITVTSSGTYGVTVTPVTGSACSIYLDTTITITLNPPAANFSSNAPQCQGTPINFTDLSNPNGSSFTAWNWDFGDGNTSSQQHPSHVYPVSGTYNVTLTVITAAGCTTSVTNPVNITSGVIPAITPAGPFCATDPVNNLLANAPGGIWTSSCGACINSSTGTFNPSMATVGSNTVTYTISGACGGADTETILVENVILNTITTTNVACFGACNGTITINATGAVSYSIDGGTSFQASNSFTGLCPGTYNIRVESAIGCFDAGTSSITEPAALTLPTSFTNETCFGACDGVAVVAPQGGTAPYNYVWSNGQTGTPAISGLCTGSYTITVTDDNGCTNLTTLVISGPAALTISSIATTDELCPGDCQGTLNITAAGATQYSIDGGITFQSVPGFTGLCSGTYSIVVKDANGCTATGNAIINTPPAVSLSAGPGSTICIGQTAIVYASASGGTMPYTFIWNQGLPNGTSNAVSPVVTTIYSVFVQDGNGCNTPPQDVTITVNPPLAVVAFSNQSICAGQSASVTAQASGGNGGPYSYLWDDGAGNTMSGATQTVTPATTTTYTVIASDNCGTPAATDVVTITVNPLPVVTFVADTLEGCTPVQVNFSNTTQASLTGTCTWDFGDGSFSTTCNEIHSFSQPGCYTITLTVTSTAGCQSSAMVSNMICVFPYPEAEFTASPQPTTVMNTLISFDNLSIDGTLYSWDFNGIGTSTLFEPQFVFPDNNPGTYPVCLTVVSSHGCMDEICHDVIIGDYFTIYVPNAFTPGGDGANDFFVPVVDGIDGNFYDFMIFNRWGDLIFRSEEVGQGWDGTHKGLQCKEDVYIWKVKVKDNENGKKKEYYGHVSLLR